MKKMCKTRIDLRNSDSIKYNNIHLIGIPEEETEKGGNLYEKIAENLIWKRKHI